MRSKQRNRAKLTLTVQVKDGKFRYKVDIGKLVGERTFSSSTGYFGSTSGYYYPSGHDKLLSEIILSKNGVERNNWTLNFKENSILEIINIDKLVREGILSYIDKVIVDNKATLNNHKINKDKFSKMGCELAY